MSTITPTYPNVIRVRHELAIALTAMLILISFILIVTTIFVIVLSTTPDAYQADQIPVVRNLIIPIPVPTPPATEFQSMLTATPSPASVRTGNQAAIPFPVPTP